MDRQTLVFVMFVDGSTDWLSLEGLAFFRDAGRVKRSVFVVVEPDTDFPVKRDMTFSPSEATCETR